MYRNVCDIVSHSCHKTEKINLETQEHTVELIDYSVSDMQETSY